MQGLDYQKLLTLELTVDSQAMKIIGRTPNGLRRIVPVSGGNFCGERLNGTVSPGADWVLNRDDGVMVIDVRLTLETDDGASIYLSYQGRFLGSSEAMERLANGQVLAESEYSLAISARFECGSERYQWLNNVIAVGVGEQTRSGPIYHVFEIG